MTSKILNLYHPRCLIGGLINFIRKSDFKSSRASKLMRVVGSDCPLRYSSSSTTDVSSVNDDDIPKYFVNRNPRNLEYMGIDHKTDGWWLQYPRKDYWHKLVLKISRRNTIAYIQHTSGKVIISASTEEWAIRKHLYSATDVAAAINIGRVLAQRCQESGITEMFIDTLETPLVGDSVIGFHKALTDAGISLEEKDEVVKERDIGTDYDRQAELGVEPTKLPWKHRSKRMWNRVKNQPRIPVLPFEDIKI